MTEHNSDSSTSRIVDELTDALAVLTVGAIAVYGEPTQAVLLAIASIALGKNYLTKR
jgi:hypothetical protein